MTDLTRLAVGVDTREPPNTFEKVQKIFPEAIHEQLPLGDIVYKNIVFEMKTWEDFVSSIKDGRFRNQIYNITLNPDIEAYYVIYGDWKEITQFSQIKMEAILGAISSIAARTNIKVLIFPNKNYAIYSVCEIIKKSVDGKEIKPVTHKTTTEDFALNMLLSSAPRFSEKAARNALEKFGTVKKIVNSEPKDFQDVKYIGKKISEEFFKTINYDFTNMVKEQEEELIEPEDLYYEEEEKKIEPHFELGAICTGSVTQDVRGFYIDENGNDTVVFFDTKGTCPDCKREHVLYSEGFQCCPICTGLMDEDYFYSKFPKQEKEETKIDLDIPAKPKKTYEQKKDMILSLITRYVQSKHKSITLKQLLTAGLKNDYTEEEIKMILHDLEFANKIYQSTTDQYDVY